MVFTSFVQTVMSSVQPVFEFMGILWSSIPAMIRFLFFGFFGFCIGFTMLRNFLT